MEVRIDTDHCPDERKPDENDVEKPKREITKLELDRRIDDVENQVQNEW